MKTRSMKASFFVFVLAIMSVAGCDKKDLPEDITELITGGSWRVGHYMDNGGDETNDFMGYSFQFNSNGTITAAEPNGSTKSGTWSHDNSSNKLIIDLGPDDALNQPLGELTDDWKVDSYTNTQISLSDDSNPSEMLVFLKN